MASIAFPHLAKAARLRDGTNYGYVYVPAQPSKPTLLLLHGFPSSSYDWRHQIARLPEAGYGVLAPDLLGYGDTDKPAEFENYKMANMCAHITELLDKERLATVIGVGHDFGCALLTRLAIRFKCRLSALVFISVGYMDPSMKLDVDTINAATKAAFGESTLGYISFFSTERSAKMVESAPDCFESLIYAADPSDFRRYLGAEGACESLLRENRILPIGDFISAAELEMHRKIFRAGGYTAPLNWYKALVRSVPSEQDARLTDEEKTIRVPTMMVVAENDHIIMPEGQVQILKHWAPQLQTFRVSTGHWAMLERREEVQNGLEQWLQSLESR